MVSDVTFTGVLSDQQQTAASTASLAEDFSQFLTLLTVQLQNQDPLDPLDTNEMTNQLVAFTGVEQQINTNQKLDDLVSLQLGNSLGSSLGYVGKDISYVGSDFYSDGQTPITINYALDGQAVDNQISIVNEEGITVFETVGSTSAGAQEFVWDGTDEFGNPVDPGTYSVRIDALGADGEGVGGTTIVTGRVTGVESQNGSLFLIVGERAVSLGNVLNVSDPNSGLNTSLTEAFEYIGRTVKFASTQFNVDETSTDPISLGYDLPKEADTLTLRVYNSAGQQVFRDDISNATSGERNYLWDGTMSTGAQAPSGSYRYEVSARDDDLNSIAVTPLNEGIVTEVESQSGKIYVNIGDRTSISIDEIIGFG